MLDREGHQKDFRPAVLDLTSEKGITDELALAKHGVLGIAIPDLRSDTSFSRQMHQVTRGSPDAFVAAYRSGVPLLVAVRAFYEAMDTPAPLLETVDTGGRWCDRYTTEDIRRIRDDEVKRITQVLAGANVVIIDDYFEHGSTLRYSSNILRAAGTESIKALCGQWYRKIDQTDDRRLNTSIDDLLVRWSPLMTMIGHEAAKVAPSTEERTLQEILENDPRGWIRESLDFSIANHYIST